MTTVFLDAVFKPFFFFNRPWHGPTTDDRSDEFPDGWLPSNHSTYGVCECKHAISNTPKEKKSHVERSGERGGHGTSPKREMRCPGNMFRTMVIDSFAVCAVAPSCWNHTLAQFILLRRSSEYYLFKRCKVPLGHLYNQTQWHITDITGSSTVSETDTTHHLMFSLHGLEYDRIFLFYISHPIFTTRRRNIQLTMWKGFRLNKIHHDLQI